MKQALLLDLDGTLLNGAGQVSERTTKAMRQAAEQGLNIFIATGRSAVSCIDAVAKLPIQSPLCCFAGRMLVAWPSQEVVHQVVMPAQSVTFLRERVKEYPVAWVEFVADKRVMFGEDRFLEAAQWALRSPYIHLASQGEQLPPGPLLQLSVVGDQAAVKQVLSEVQAGMTKDMLRFEEYELGLLPHAKNLAGSLVDFQGPGPGKATLVDHLLSQGYERDQIVAVGDSTNDIAMLEQAGLALAVDNASAALKTVADRTIGHHDEEGIAELLEQWCVQKHF